MACSLASRIAAAEAGVPIATAHVDLSSKLLDDGSSFLEINPLGQVSVLRLTDGTLLTETSAVLVWLQTHAQTKSFRIPADSAGYFQMLRWLGFCATELHKQLFRIVFYPEATNEVKGRIRELVPARLKLLDAHLAQQSFLVGDHFSAADAYLIWALLLMPRAQVNVSGYPALHDYQQRLAERALVAQMLEADEARLARKR